MGVKIREKVKGSGVLVGLRELQGAARFLEATGYHTTRAAGSFSLFDIVAINARGSA